MADDFDFKKFLTENTLGAYSKVGKPREDENFELEEDEKEGPVSDYGQRRQGWSPNPELDAMTMKYVNEVFAEFEGGGYTKAAAIDAIAQSLVRLKNKV